MKFISVIPSIPANKTHYSRNDEILAGAGVRLMISCSSKSSASRGSNAMNITHWEQEIDDAAILNVIEREEEEGGEGWGGEGGRNNIPRRRG